MSNKGEINKKYKEMVDKQVDIYGRINSLIDELDEFMAGDHGDYTIKNLDQIYNELVKNLEHQQVIRRMMHRAMDTSHERWI